MGLARAARGRDAGYASACRQTWCYATLLAELRCFALEVRRAARATGGPLPSWTRLC